MEKESAGAHRDSRWVVVGSQRVCPPQRGESDSSRIAPGWRKTETTDGGGASAARTAPPEFVDLIVPRTTGRAEYTIELEGREGTLRIHCKGTSAADLVRLSRALWGAVSWFRSPRNSASWWRSRPLTDEGHR